MRGKSSQKETFNTKETNKSTVRMNKMAAERPASQNVRKTFLGVQGTTCDIIAKPTSPKNLKTEQATKGKKINENIETSSLEASNQASVSPQKHMASTINNE
jgi:hypothetical protein